VPLVRTDEQLEAVLAADLPEVELDWMELAGLGAAVERARARGLRVVVATLRVTKPGERAFDERLLKLRPDGILVRHLGALTLFGALPLAERPLLHGDFALNACNSIAAAQLFAAGLDTLTPAHDLDQAQLRQMLAGIDASRITATLHVRMPTFHTEHCVYSHVLSAGRDYRTCGRPCEQHRLTLRDHLGFEHPVIVDAGCRNTVFNGILQTSAPLAQDLVACGVRRFRVEFVRESGAETAAALATYAALLRGETTSIELQRRLRAEPHLGVAKKAQQTMARAWP
jgi:putative protease